MARENRGLVAIVIILVIALLVVVYFWQRDRESQELEFEIGHRGEAEVVILVDAPGTDPEETATSPPGRVRFAPIS